MAARLTDKKKKKIVADYLETQSINATAKKNNVSWGTVRSVLDGMGEIEEKLEQKKEQNTVDILAYMESQKGIVIGKGASMIKEIRQASLQKMKEIFPFKIDLDLQVKVSKNWRHEDSVISKIIP